MSSMQTTLIRSAARNAESEWKTHKGECPRCTRASRARQWDDLCRFGGPMRDAMTALAQELAESRYLDKLPSPDQPPLF
jgi:hypothetical protein